MIVFAHSGLNDAEPEGAAGDEAGAADDEAGAADDEVPDDESDADPPPHAASTATNGTMARARQEILMRRA